MSNSLRDFWSKKLPDDLSQRVSKLISSRTLTFSEPEYDIDWRASESNFNSIKNKGCSTNGRAFELCQILVRYIFCQKCTPDNTAHNTAHRGHIFDENEQTDSVLRGADIPDFSIYSKNEDRQKFLKYFLADEVFIKSYNIVDEYKEIVITSQRAKDYIERREKDYIELMPRFLSWLKSTLLETSREKDCTQDDADLINLVADYLPHLESEFSALKDQLAEPNTGRSR